MNIVEMLDPRVTGIKIKDLNEELVDIRSKSNLLVGEPPESSETAPHYCLLREGIISKLENAQAKLAQGQFLRIYEGYRNPKFQSKLFTQELERTKKMAAGLSDEQYYKAAAKMVSPVETFKGEKIIPPHSTGGAVDIEIVDDKGQVLDFGMEISDWVKVKPDFCRSDFQDLNENAKINRKMLISLMESEGFINYPREWWHFSYGDQYWAFLSGNQVAYYDRVG